MASDFVEVSKAEFHATVGQLNMHLRPEREESYWETPYREILGITRPGYIGGVTKQYFVHKRFVSPSPKNIAAQETGR